MLRPTMGRFNCGLMGGGHVAAHHPQRDHGRRTVTR